MMNQDRMVFESPDGGETVYKRKFGDSERELHSVSEKKRELIDELRENQLWGNIHRAAKTNPTLQKALDRAILIYRLSEPQ
jgi:hypothetical protein